MFFSVEYTILKLHVRFCFLWHYRFVMSHDKMINLTFKKAYDILILVITSFVIHLKLNATQRWTVM